MKRMFHKRAFLVSRWRFPARRRSNWSRLRGTRFNIKGQNGSSVEVRNEEYPWRRARNEWDERNE